MHEKQALIKTWEEFVERRNKSGTINFSLNPDKTRVEALAEGVLENEKNHGLKYCPCRMLTKRIEEDLRLICPCNFPSQKQWKEQGECWCSLFVKVKK